MTLKVAPIVEWPSSTNGRSAADFIPPQHDIAVTASPHDQRTRSLSLSLPWRRPRLSIFGHEDHRILHNGSEEHAIDDTFESRDRSGHDGLPGSTTIKHMIRRASYSLKGIVGRRSSIAVDNTIHEQDLMESRPTTSSGPWSRLRQAANFRPSRSFYGLDLSHPGTAHHNPDHYTDIPLPAMGDEPPYIPSHSGAAAKASVALQKSWMYRTTSEDQNDRESGIGIAVPGAYADEDDDCEPISRIDFVNALPTELAIHVLAQLDAEALAMASAVCKSWAKVIENQHIWRESCLRETGATYATSGAVQPNVGLGVPPITPNNDWKHIYRMKQDLTQRWKDGRARPTYLNGHTDSIYCLQFDEYDTKAPHISYGNRTLTLVQIQDYLRLPRQDDPSVGHAHL